MRFKESCIKTLEIFSIVTLLMHMYFVSAELTKPENVNFALFQNPITSENLEKTLKSWISCHQYRYESYTNKTFIQIVGEYPCLKSEYGPNFVSS